MYAFHFEMHKTADFLSNLLVYWELVTEDYQGKPVKISSWFAVSYTGHLEISTQHNTIL